MPCILHIETSTEICSVGISENTKLIHYEEVAKPMSHASMLGVFIKKAMDYLDKAGKKINAVAISCGPGSYTGLRIGTSMAKGLCYGLDIPLIAVSTLKAMTVNLIREKQYEDCLFCPMIDARRMEAYTALYNNALKTIKDTSATIVEENTFSDLLATNKIVFFGNGSEKCKSVITHPNAIFIDNIHPTAKNMLNLALEKYNQSQFEDVAYFEPYYLKDFVATTPKNKF